MKRFLRVPTFLFVLLLEALSSIVYAQSGKLSGTVKDAANGQGLPGVTVILQNTNLGGVTDSQGRYNIIGVSAGVYTVRYSFVGYDTKTVSNVRVTSSITTTQNVELSESRQATEVSITAQRMVVDQNQTASRALVTGEEINNLPVTNLNEALGKTSNSYDGYVRGSRRFETKTIVEGVDISDAFYTVSQVGNTVTMQNTNRADQTSASMFNLNPESVEEVSVNTGATGANYSSASGGVVAISLAEGRGKLRGSFSARIAPSIGQPGPDSLAVYLDGAKYTTERDALLASANTADVTRAKLYYGWTPDKYTEGGPEMDVRGSIGGSLGKFANFSLSGQLFQSNGYLPNYYRKSVNGQFKSTFNLTSSTQLSLVGLIQNDGLWGNWNNRDYQDLWRFYLEGVAQKDGGSYMGSAMLRQNFGKKSFATVQMYRTFKQSRIGYVDDNGDGFTQLGEQGDFIDLRTNENIAKYIGASSGTNKRDEVAKPRMFIDIQTDTGGSETAGIFTPTGGRFRTARPTPFQEDITSQTDGLKFDFTSQVNNEHLIQFGAEYKKRSFDFFQIDGLPGESPMLNPQLEPYMIEYWDRHPTETSLYISDRMEYAGLKINAGLRVDMIDRDMQKITDYFFPMTQQRVDYQGRSVLRNVFVRGEEVPVDVLWNPRIGISHPIGSTASMYFAYSRSQQLLSYFDMYRLYSGNFSRNVFAPAYRDPETDPITSNNFELGVQWEFIPGWGVDINAYGRSIANYGLAGFSTTNRTPAGQTAVGLSSYSFVTDFGYADARGIELVLRRAPRKLTEDIRLSANVSYTYSSVESAAAAGVNQTSFVCTGACVTQLPFDNAEDFKNYAINAAGGTTLTGGFNRLHRVIARGTSTLPFGISAGLNATFESGFLYRKAIGADPRGRELLTAPYNAQVDLRLEKRFNFGQSLGLDVYLDGKNILNRHNIVGYDTSVANQLVFLQDQGIPGTRLVLGDGTTLYGPGRTFYFGARVRF